MMAPDEKTQYSDRHAREGDKGVTENYLSGKGRDQLTDNPHRGQDHDVDRGMRIKPEQMLKEDRVTPIGWIEDADMVKSLKRDEHKGNGDDWSTQHHDEAIGVV